MTRSMLLVLPVLTLSVTLAGARAVDVEHHMNGSDARAVAEFTAAVDRYLELHLLLESPMSALIIDPEQATRARRAHRAAILAARSLDRRGDVFTPRVSTYLRRQIALAEGDTDVAILGRLPGLPKGLDYRITNRDLTLVDVELDLVVDVLEDALPPDTSGEPEPGEPQEFCAPEPAPARPHSPCDVHPELEMCWS